MNAIFRFRNSEKIAMEHGTIDFTMTSLCVGIKEDVSP